MTVDEILAKLIEIDLSPEEKEEEITNAIGDLIHDAMSRKASELCNRSLKDQITFLLEEGMEGQLKYLWDDPEYFS